MKNKFILLSILIVQYFIIGCSSGRLVNFVSTNKDKLMDGNEELRFVSFNIPNLHYIEDYFAFESSNPWRLPNEYEIRDALTAIKLMNGKVARTYVLSVRKEGESKKIIRHVETPGVFNEDAFKALDKVLQIANEVGIRIIIPLVDNWWWWGGPVEYAAFRGKERDDFWTDPLLISDFKKTIEFIVTRRNTYTGILYKDDKALFGWETGNELVCPFSWTAEIASYIKSLDPNHLIIEGTHAPLITDEAINNPHIDVLSTHHYTNADESIKNILKNKELSKEKKPYFIGEFGLTTPQNIKAIVDTVINNDISGIMIWSLRFHNRDGGFYMHRENTGAGSYRFPGFSSGENYNEKEIINFMRIKAYEINNKVIPPVPVPKPPVLLEIKDVYSISWQGSTGASSYIIDRRESNSDIWITIAEDITDADIFYKPLFIDSMAILGSSYFYRVKAKNESGISEPSNVKGPVDVNFLRIVDELIDESKIFSKEGNIEQIKFKDIYKVKEDNSRLAVYPGSSVIYSVPENLSQIKVYVFNRDDACIITLFGSELLEIFEQLTTKIETFPPHKNVYGFMTPALYSCEEFPEKTRFIKIFFSDEAHLSRVEIEFAGDSTN